MRYSWKEDGRNLAVLILLAVVIFGFGLGSFGLLDPDEPFYSLTAKEMLLRHDWSTPVIFGHPQFEKPIFFYWVVYLCFKLFGVTELASRIGPFSAGLVTVVITYLWGVVLFKKRQIALVSSAVLATATEFFIVSKIVLTDVYLCLFVTAALFFFSLGYENSSIRKRAWFFIFVSCAFGFLTKGPIAVIFPWMAISAFFIFNHETRLFKQFPWMPGAAAFIVIGCSWYVLMTMRYGTYFLQHFFIHENARRFFFAEHPRNDKVYFYPAALVVGFFPWSAFVLGAIFYATKRVIKKDGGRFLKPFVLLFFSLALPFIFLNAAKSKLLSYILPVFPALALLIGAWMFRVCRALKMGALAKTSLKVLSVIFFAALPAALVIGGGVYGYISELNVLTPLLLIGSLLILPFWYALFEAFRRNYTRAFLIVLVSITISSGFVFSWLLPSVQEMVSSKDEAALYNSAVTPGKINLILASKMYVRGASYYTGNGNVAVLTDSPNGPFYTKHDIPLIWSPEKLAEVDKNMFPVYCFIKTKDLDLLKNVTDHKFSITPLRENAHRTLVRLDLAV